MATDMKRTRAPSCRHRLRRQRVDSTARIDTFAWSADGASGVDDHACARAEGNVPGDAA
jgi:hypothetical protein